MSDEPLDVSVQLPNQDTQLGNVAVEPTNVKPERTTDEPSDARTVGFFQTMRLLQTTYRSRVGGDTRAKHEPVRLRVDSTAAFPSTEVAKLSSNSETTQAQLDVSFFGLFGASGALPHHYTQLVIDRTRLKDHSLRNFLDLFNHRLISMFYRAWERNHFPISFETASAASQEDTLTKGLWALIGNRAPSLRDRMRVDEGHLLFFAGHLSRARPIAGVLENMLQSIYGVPAQIKSFQGQWMHLAVEDQSKLGSAPLGVSIGNQLGIETVAGSRIWDVENRFRVSLGPVDFSTFMSLTPLADLLKSLAQWVRRYVGAQYDFDIQVIIKREEVRGMRLGDSGSSNLGWNTWLGDWPFEHDASDAVFEMPDSSLQPTV